MTDLNHTQVRKLLTQFILVKKKGGGGVPVESVTLNFTEVD